VPGRRSLRQQPLHFGDMLRSRVRRVRIVLQRNVHGRSSWRCGEPLVQSVRLQWIGRRLSDDLRRRRRLRRGRVLSRRPVREPASQRRELRCAQRMLERALRRGPLSGHGGQRLAVRCRSVIRV
jgi:hypothetical protein